MSALDAVILILGGGAAGFINTLAGGGSAITIPILNEMVGISVANGTNRIAVLAATITGAAGFQKGKAIPWQRLAPLIPPVLIGAGLGAWAATHTDPDLLKRVFAVVLLLVAGSVVARPSRWVEERDATLHEPWRSLAFVAIGFYGGFVQAGVGFLLLAGLVLGGGLTLVNGNAAKVVLVLAYTPVALLLFAQAAQVDWTVGLVLASGQMTGAWIAARLAVKKGASWIRWVLVAAAVVAAVRLFTT